MNLSNYDERWFEQQREELKRVLLQQGARMVIPQIPSFTSVPQPETINTSQFIDHTLLKPEATSEQIEKLVEEALQFKFASVCVNPSFVSLCNRLLQGSDVKVCTVIGFPLGAVTTLTKIWESRDAIANGSQEIDMVIPVGKVKEKDYLGVLNDISSVVQAADGILVKVILETSLLTKEEIGHCCLLASMSEADFVKTSTGFGGGGATVEDIALMKKFVGDRLGVKASGGIRDKQTALAMIKAGATRIGTSSGVMISQGGEGLGGY